MSNSVGKTYRILHRDRIIAGSWHYSVSCHGCSKPIYLFDDVRNGEGFAVQMAGDGALSAPCPHCLHDENPYEISALIRVKADEAMPSSYPTRPTISKSPRQPMWKAYPKAKATFGVGYIEDRPQAAAIVARIITSWADIEVESARLLATLMGTNIQPTSAVFGVLRSSRVQYDALNAVAAEVLSTQDLELFSAHMARRATLEGERNDLAHGSFGVSPAIPDHVVWISQADKIQQMARHESGVIDPVPQEKYFVYEVGTLERIAQEIAEFYHQLSSLRGYFIARKDPSQNAIAFCAERYPQLCSQPHIAEVLARLRQAKQKTNAAPPSPRPAKKHGKRK